MRVLGISVVCIISLCLMTYGFTGVSFAQSDQPPLSVNTDQNLYTENAKITVSGTVKDSSLLKNPTPVIIQILNFFFQSTRLNLLIENAIQNLPIVDIKKYHV